MGIDRVLAQVSTASPRAKYRRVNIYVRSRLALAFRKAAVREGFRVGDLARMLIMAGMVVRLLSLNQERLDHIRELNQMAGHEGKRPYSIFRAPHRGSVWIAVWLPVLFLAFVDQYAKLRSESRNVVLHSFFQLGLLAYLRGKTRFLKALAT